VGEREQSHYCRTHILGELIPEDYAWHVEKGSEISIYTYTEPITIVTIINLIPLWKSKFYGTGHVGS
jgi:hypothetical protein